MHSMGRVAIPVEVNRPLVVRNNNGSISEAMCFTIHEPAAVAEKALTMREYIRYLA
jgi:hypothetical protein